MRQRRTTKTVVVLALDRSGWLNLVKDEIIAGMNAFLGVLQREATDLVELTILQSNSVSHDVMCSGATPTDVPPFTAANYRPRGCQAFLDGCLAAIRTAEQVLVSRADKPNVVLVFHVGGEDSVFMDDKAERLSVLIRPTQARRLADHPPRQRGRYALHRRGHRHRSGRCHLMPWRGRND